MSIRFTNTLVQLVFVFVFLYKIEIRFFGRNMHANWRKNVNTSVRLRHEVRSC